MNATHIEHNRRMARDPAYKRYYERRSQEVDDYNLKRYRPGASPAEDKAREREERISEREEAYYRAIKRLEREE